MFELTGAYGTAKIFSDGYDEKAVGQIIQLLNQPFVDGHAVRIMSDYHFGAGCTIGFTCNLGDKVVPNLVGVDIGCGVLVMELGQMDISLERLDKVIHEHIPAGKTAHKEIVRNFDKIKELRCYDVLKHQANFAKQIGTLGGGNHFIELDVDSDNNKYLVIHSGSRNLGKQVADYYQKLAIETIRNEGITRNDARIYVIESLKKQGKGHQIPMSLKRLDDEFDKLEKKSGEKIPDNLCYLEGQNREDYLHDMAICQEYASLNRKTIGDIINSEMWGFSSKWEKIEIETFETIHNYVSDGLIRKGAVSAKEGEVFIVPINMRDGSLICIGKGNADWNFSAPHGAGRLMGRNEAKRTLSLEKYKEDMQGIYSTTVCRATLDESPDVYKSIEEIVENIDETATIIKKIKPLYVFKDATSEEE